MEENINISIGGYSFTLEPAAYTLLSNYLDAIRQRLGSGPEADEVINSIEERLAELISQNSGADQYAKTQAIQAAIDTIGRPEQIAAEGSTPPEPAPTRSRNRGRLYRDPDHTVIGGVCAGIAARLDIPSWVLRVLFCLAVCFYGFGLLLYIILWVSIPVARTPLQKLELHGEPITFDTLERQTKAQFQNARDALRPENRSETGNRLANFLYSIVLALWTILLGLGKVVIKLVGVTLMLGSAIAEFCVLFTLGVFYTEGFFPYSNAYLGWPFYEIATALTENLLFSILLALTITLLLAALFLLGLRCMTKFKFPVRVAIISGCIWLLLLVATSLCTVKILKQTNANESAYTEELPVTAATGDTLCITADYLTKARQDASRNSNTTTFTSRWGSFSVYIDGEELELIPRNDVLIQLSADSTPQVRITHWSRSDSPEETERIVKDLESHLAIEGHNIILPTRAHGVRHYYKKGYRNQIWVDLPAGYHLTIDPQLRDNVWWWRQSDSTRMFLQRGSIYRIGPDSIERVGDAIAPQQTIEQ